MPRKPRSKTDTALAIDRLIREHGAPNFFHFSEVQDAGGASPSAQRRTKAMFVDDHDVRRARGGWRVD